MPIQSFVQRSLRRLGWEVQRFRNAHVEHQVLKQILVAAGADVVLDVGANVGQFGDLLLDTGFAGTLISFEAIPAVHEKLARHARVKSGSWIVAPCAALGSRRGTIAMNVAANSVSSSILPMQRAHVEAAPESKYVEQQIVAVERLDELAPGLLPPDGQLLIKIDTQGYEMEVLKGATGLLPRTVALQMELSLAVLYAGAPSFVEMIEYVNGLGFELFSLVPGFKNAHTGRLLQMDGFFVRSGSNGR
jgi:FkbM family methyltransferase